MDAARLPLFPLPAFVPLPAQERREEALTEGKGRKTLVFFTAPDDGSDADE
jgi:hypothetical protein